MPNSSPNSTPKIKHATNAVANGIKSRSVKGKTIVFSSRLLKGILRNQKKKKKNRDKPLINLNRLSIKLNVDKY